MQATREKKKAIFEKTRPHDEDLWKITEEERHTQERLHQIRAQKIERDQREKYATEKKGLKTKEEVRLQTELEALKSENDRINQQLVTLSDERSNEFKELNVLRRKNSEQNELLEVLRTETEQLKTDCIKHTKELQVYRHQNESLTELKEKLQHITSLSEAQQKTIKCWEDKISAAQQVAVETQLRQLDELQSLTEETAELKQILTTLHRQHPDVEQHRQGKYCCLFQIFQHLTKLKCLCN